MTGKQKCAILKEIRRDIAAKNDIAITIAECTHQGKCSGTCPRCEAEVRALERELEKKRKRGQKTVLAGISVGLLAANLSACKPVEAIRDAASRILHPNPVIEELEGDVPMEVETAETEMEGDPIAPETETDTTDGLIEAEPEIDGEPEIMGIVPETEPEPLMGEPVAYAEEMTDEIGNEP